MFNFTTRKITRAATVAALYAVATMLVPELSYGIGQCRISEALTVLPLFMPEAVIGLTIGCLIANIIGLGIIDIVFGTLATFIAATMTYFIGKIFKSHLRLLGVIPPIVVNAIVVPFIILAVTEEKISYFLLMGEIFLGQTIAICALGIPLYFLINRYKCTILFSDYKYPQKSVQSPPKSEDEEHNGD